MKPVSLQSPRATTLFMLLVCACLLPAYRCVGQQVSADRPLGDRFLRSSGGQVVLTNSGFGLGGHVRLPLMGQSLLVELSVAAGKDAREIAVFDRLGQRDVVNKANHLLLIPAHAGFEHRLFSGRIEDSFRPYVVVAGGPTLGWVSPHYSDADGNGSLDEGERTFDALTAIPHGRGRIGLGGTLAIGAHFGGGGQVTQGVRVGYSFSRFRKGISLLDESSRPPQRFWGTPSIIISFTRLW